MPNHQLSIYLICPVRKVTSEVKARLDSYVATLEKQGHHVHYPPRDVDQTLSGPAICRKHCVAMQESDEVHVFWDATSMGSHFDLGMAFMSQYLWGISVRIVGDVASLGGKSFADVVRSMAGE